MLAAPDSDPADDYHIGIGFDEDLAGTAEQVKNNRKDPNFGSLRKGSIVVDMTPHYRAKYHNGKWTEPKLEQALGYKVKVVGQLLSTTTTWAPTLVLVALHDDVEGAVHSGGG